jgi:hypothetical protein
MGFQKNNMRSRLEKIDFLTSGENKAKSLLRVFLGFLRPIITSKITKYAIFSIFSSGKTWRPICDRPCTRKRRPGHSYKLKNVEKS